MFKTYIHIYNIVYKEPECIVYLIGVPKEEWSDTSL